MSNKLSYNTGSNGTYTFSHDEIAELFKLLPLPVRVGAAAKVLSDLNHTEGWIPSEPWSVTRLEAGARRLEAKDAENAKRAAEIEELAHLIFAEYPQAQLAEDPKAYWDSHPLTKVVIKSAAQKIYNAGYRKQESA